MQATGVRVQVQALQPAFNAIVRQADHYPSITKRGATLVGCVLPVGGQLALR